MVLYNPSSYVLGTLDRAPDKLLSVPRGAVNAPLTISLTYSNIHHTVMNVFIIYEIRILKMEQLFPQVRLLR